MKVYYLIFIFIAILSVTLVSAEDSLGTFKQNSCIKLIQTCANCSFVNITSITYPNSSQIVGQVAMTKISTLYNYSFCNTSVIGTYRVTGFGDSDGIGLYNTFNYLFTVTPAGTEFNTPIAITISALGLFLVSILAFSIGMMVRSNSATAKISYFNIIYIATLVTLFLIWYVASNFLFIIPFLGSILYYSWFIMMILLLPLILVSIGYMIIINIQNKRNDHLLSMGYSTNEAQRYSKRR